MKKTIFFLLVALACARPACCHVMQELWNKYAPKAQVERQTPSACPGRIFGKPLGGGESSFHFPWKYRSATYELHFENPAELARSIYSLALFAHDISPDLPREKFYGGVQGFHYSARQVADWLNHVLAGHVALDQQENAFAGLMLEDGVVRIGAKGFEPGPAIRHVLGAAHGKKRNFAHNLHHERLHVYWDENEQMRKEANAAWQALGSAEKAAARKKLRSYAQDNEEQLVEEWAVYNAENSPFSIK